MAERRPAPCRPIYVMALEIERRFLVAGDGWRSGSPGVVIRQGYLPCQPDLTWRVRLAGRQGFLTVKTLPVNAVRHEVEAEIPETQALHLLDTACVGGRIDKVRHTVPVAGLTWYVDEFAGSNAGLVLAEIELSHPDQYFVQPCWLGAEVTGDRRYSNSNLARRPIALWGELAA
jgi:adenylate cyclase